MRELVCDTFIKMTFNVRVHVISINFTDGYFHAAGLLRKGMLWRLLIRRGQSVCAPQARCRRPQVLGVARR